MELILSCALVVLTGLLWWQGLYQNNVTLFQKRLNLYQDFSRKFHRFVGFAEYLDKNLIFILANNIDNEKQEDAVLQEKIDILNKSTDLEGAIHPMLLVGFSKKINDNLIAIKENSSIVTDFLTQTTKRKSDVTNKLFKESLEYLQSASKESSILNIQFNCELPLRNFKFYIKKHCSKLCYWCNSNN